MKKTSFYHGAVTLFVAALDYVLFLTSLLIGYWLWITFPWHGNFQSFAHFSQILWALPPIAVLVFTFWGLYKQEMGVLGVEEQSLIFQAIGALYVIVFALSFFYREVAFSRLAVFYSILIATVLISVERYFFRHFFQRLHKRGISLQKALIYGAGYYGQRLERWISQSPKLGIQVVGFLDDNLENLVKVPVEPPCLGGFEDLRKLVKSKHISVLFVAHRKLEEEGIAEIFQTCREIGIQCWMIPMLYQFHLERARLTNIGGMPLVSFQAKFGSGSNFFKDLLDRALAVLLLPLLFPFMVIIALGIRLTSSGPVFFRQTRVGRHDKKFVMLKFRTLKKNAPKTAVSPELQKDSAATTRFGAFLRRTGLDELPQVINVLKGDMSFVGPRPEMPFLVAKYGALERERLNVKPGITGLWQISEDRKRILIHENMDYDLYYVEHMSLSLDLAIAIKTVFFVAGRFFKNPVTS